GAVRRARHPLLPPRRHARPASVQGPAVRVPLGWLQEFFDEPLPEVGEVTDLLDGLGLSVETVHELPAAPEGVLVARVEEVEPVPGSDRLSRVTVSYPGATTQVVCGAPNVAAGMLSALATPGSVLPGLPVA